MTDNFFKKSLSKINNYFEKIITFKKSPHAIAFGFSVGSFIALFPTFGLGYFIGLGILIIMPKLNKVSLFLGITFWNPLFLVPYYSLSYKFGNFLMGNFPKYYFNFALENETVKLSIRFLLGNIILSLTISLLLYFAILICIKYLYKSDSSKNKT